MNLPFLMYIEIDLFCLFLLFFILFKSNGSMENRKSHKLFRCAVCSVILLTLSDFMWGLSEAGKIPFSHTALYLINCCYFVFSIFATAFWFFYTESEMDTLPITRKSVLVVTAAPLVLMLCLLTVSYFNGCLFSITPQGTFSRGPLYLLIFLLPCFYLVLSLVHALILASRKENYANRKKYTNLASFALTPTVACILQVFLPGTPLPCIGITTGMLRRVYQRAGNAGFH